MPDTREAQNERLYTPQEVIDILKISRNTLSKYAAEGKLKPIKLSPKKFLYPQNALDNLFEECS